MVFSKCFSKEKLWNLLQNYYFLPFLSFLDSFKNVRRMRENKLWNSLQKNYCGVPRQKVQWGDLLEIARLQNTAKYKLKRKQSPTNSWKHLYVLLYSNNSLSAINCFLICFPVMLIALTGVACNAMMVWRTLHWKQKVHCWAALK